MCARVPKQGNIKDALEVWHLEPRKQRVQGVVGMRHMFGW